MSCALGIVVNIELLQTRLYCVALFLYREVQNLMRIPSTGVATKLENKFPLNEIREYCQN